MSFSINSDTEHPCCSARIFALAFVDGVTVMFKGTFFSPKSGGRPVDSP